MANLKILPFEKIALNTFRANFQNGLTIVIKFIPAALETATGNKIIENLQSVSEFFHCVYKEIQCFIFYQNGLFAD